MPSTLRKIFKYLHTGAVIAIRRKRPRENGASASQPSPATTDSPENVPCTITRRFDAGDAVEHALPLVGAAAGVIPVAGHPLKAAVDGLLYILQTIDVNRLFYYTASLLIAPQTKRRNKAALDDLASRVGRLSDFLSQQPQPRDEVEAGRRADLTKWASILKSCLLPNAIPRSDVSKTPSTN